MKIEKISLCNLASIDGEFVIDFGCEPLRSAGLFAITGDTGAGKSTLLDAVCLALYNNAPRFDDVQKFSKNRDEQTMIAGLQTDDVRNILRRGAREAYSKVEFSLPDGARYEATWSVRVKRTGTYDKVQRTLRCLSPRRMEIPEREVAQTIERITGLKYSQFTHTVMLAQNSFTKFLKANRAEKSELLERLTGTEIYGEISKKIYELKKNAEEACRVLDSEMKGVLVNRLEPEILRQTEEEKGRLETSIGQCTRRSEAVKAQLQWFADYGQATARVLECEALGNEAHKAYVALRADELRVERYDQVIRVLPLFNEIKMTEKDIVDYKRRESEVAEEVRKAALRLEEADAGLAAAKEAVREKEQQQRLRLPEISRGFSLTGEVSSAKAQCCVLERRFAEAESALGEQRLLHRQCVARIEEVQRQMEAASLHKQALSVHSPMLENCELVLEKLRRLLVETNTLGDIDRSERELGERIKNRKVALDAAVKEQRREQDELYALGSELDIHRQANDGTDGEMLRKSHSERTLRLNRLLAAQALWKRIAEGYGEIEEQEVLLREQEVQCDHLKTETDALERELRAKEEVFESLHLNYTLSKKEDIRQLRQQLKEGSPCPVCGAAHHPYHSETEREMGALLSNLEKDYLALKEDVERRKKDLTGMQRDLAARIGVFTTQKDYLVQRRRRQEEDVLAWKDCAELDASFKDCSPSVSREARTLLIGMLIDNCRKTVEETEEELRNFHFHQQHINRLNEAIAAIVAARQHAQAAYDELVRDYQGALAKLEEMQRTKEKCQRAGEVYYADLDAVISLSGWYTGWLADPDALSKRISELNADWKQTSATLDEAARKKDVLKEELRSAEEKLAEQERQMALQRDELAACRQSISEKEAELQRMFGGGSPEKEEQLLNEALRAARTVEENRSGERAEAHSRCKILQQECKVLQQECAKKQEACRKCKDELDGWIVRFNGEHSPVQFAELERIFSDTTDWKQLRTTINERREALTLATNKLETARRELAQVQSRPGRPSGEDDESQAALLEQQQEIETRSKTLQEQLGVVNSRLLAHSTCLRQTLDLQERLEAARKTCAEWQMLDADFGSADGKRFRSLAQSYTFGFLVDHANRQLERLSPRYRLLTIPGELTLKIIDRDMFDEQRYVSSLSGGESFVVSLALALGLASLSADSLSIGSLFIDEGFGNLDRESLDLVLSALGNLENTQGRKVGIISHTNQIRRHISPQIRLVKAPTGGRSSIEIG